MKKLFLLMLLMPSFAFAALGPDDNLIVPGERVGLITKTTTLKELEEYFAKSGKQDQIKTYFGDIGEGVLACKTTIFPKTPREATIVWNTNDEKLGYSYDTPITDEAVQKEWDRKCAHYVQSAIINNIELLGDYSPEIHKRIPFAYLTTDGLRSELNIKELNKLNGVPTRYTILCECCGDNSLGFGGGKYGGYLFGVIEPRFSEKEENQIREIYSKRYSVENYTDDLTQPQLPKRFEDKIFLVGLNVYFERQEYGY